MLTGQNKINLILEHIGIKAPTFAKMLLASLLLIGWGCSDDVVIAPPTEPKVPESYEDFEGTHWQTENATKTIGGTSHTITLDIVITSSGLEVTEEKSIFWSYQLDNIRYYPSYVTFSRIFQLSGEVGDYEQKTYSYLTWDAYPMLIIKITYTDKNGESVRITGKLTQKTESYT